MTIVALVVGTLLAALGLLARSALRVAEHLVEDEIKARLPHAATSTLARAIETLPEELRETRRGEWTAELTVLADQRLRAVWFARQCLRAAVTEAREYERAAAGHTRASSRRSRVERTRARLRARQERRYLFTARGQLLIAAVSNITLVFAVLLFTGSLPEAFLAFEVYLLLLCVVAIPDRSFVTRMLTWFEPLSSHHSPALLAGLFSPRFVAAVPRPVFGLQFGALASLLVATGRTAMSPFIVLAVVVPLVALRLARSVRGVIATIVATGGLAAVLVTQMSFSLHSFDLSTFLMVDAATGWWLMLLYVLLRDAKENARRTQTA